MDTATEERRNAQTEEEKLDPTQWDFGDDAEDEGVVSNKTLAKLGLTAVKLLQAEKRVEDLEEELSIAKKRRDNIQQKEIPSVMGENFEGDVKLPEEDFIPKEVRGKTIKIGDKVRCHLKADMKPKAIAYLNAHGASNIVKRQIVIDFAKDEEKWANKFERDMARRVRKIPYKRTMTVAHPTLEAYVREQIKNGEDIPLETFGVFTQKQVKIK